MGLVCNAGVPGTAASAAATQTILVHEMAGTPPEVLARAEREVTRIFSRANVRIEWLYCSAIAGEPNQPHPCPSLPAGTIIVRIVPATLDFLRASTLGYAPMPGPAGLYATVSFRRVQLCVARQTTSAASLEQVLGHAIAHELGHILLGTNAHSPAGLMQPQWNAHTLDDASKARLNFSSEQARRIQDAVAQRMRYEMAGAQVAADESTR